MSPLSRGALVAATCVTLCAIPPAQTRAPLAGSAIPQFVDPLPVLDVAGGTMATVIAGPSEIELHMREFRARMLPSSFVPATGTYDGTWVWGYTAGPNPSSATADTYLGPVVIATRDVPAQVRFVNDLGNAATTNVLAWVAGMDQTLHWADPLNAETNSCAHAVQPGMPPMGSCAQHYTGPIPAVVHLHGGDLPPVIDGGPDAWFTSDGLYHGHGYYTHPNLPAAGNEAIYRYPNGQEAAPIWFHDHALGITRLNVYAGLAGAYVIVDPALQLPVGLHPLGLQQGSSGAVEFTIPLVIQDRMFDVEGQLYFPNEGENPEHPFWLPEFVGDAICVNGKTWPYLQVAPKRYRFLILNGSNARGYELFVAKASKDGSALQEASQVPAAGPVMWQIGTDGGYLDAPAQVASNRSEKLVLMPGERADVIIDFAAFAGQTLLLRNTARTPYPRGEVARSSTVGRLLQFRVGAGPVADSSYDPALGIPIRASGQQIVRLVDATTGSLATGVTVQKVRQLTLNEVMGEEGPLESLLNNTKWSGTGRPDFTPVTIGSITTYYSELPQEGDTEQWEVVNLTADAHPIHTHLTQCQILSRQRFNTALYEAAYASAFPGGAYLPGFGPPLDYATGNARALGGNPDITPFLQGVPIPPSPNEAGWKDTMVMLPGQVTRFVVRYAPQDTPVSASATYAFDPSAGGHGYVWHCHILDHEDNEMMRPLSVVPEPGAIRTYVMGVDY